jgi:hypothetical protein
LRKAEEDLSAEMQEQGYSPKEAGLRASQGIEQAKEGCRDARATAWFALALRASRIAIH